LEFLAPFWDNVSNDAKDLIQKMLTRDQKKRIKASELLQHPWLIEDLTAAATSRSNSTTNIRSTDNLKPKTKNLHDEISKNLSEFFRRSSRDPAITLVTVRIIIFNFPFGLKNLKFYRILLLIKKI
jgi:calcium-dependent protein kinase